jgi:hypothetical protein
MPSPRPSPNLSPMLASARALDSDFPDVQLELPAHRPWSAVGYAAPPVRPTPVALAPQGPNSATGGIQGATTAGGYQRQGILADLPVNVHAQRTQTRLTWQTDKRICSLLLLLGFHL